MGTTLVVVVALGVLTALWRHAGRSAAIRAAGVSLTVALVGVGAFSSQPANAAIVPTVGLGTAADYAVLGASEVTNVGPSVLNGDLGVSPGTAITGFPPGLVVPPATIHVDAVAAQAQSDLTVAYNDAAGRELNETTTADLGGLQLVGGVYAGPSKGALLLTGPLVLDGANDLNSVFIFQTDSSLTTATGSSVTLINGAQACNVFWQVGSSATLSGSVFAGNVMAFTSVTVNDSVTVEGRALARNGAVTLQNDTFVEPSCLQAVATTTTTTSTSTSTTTSTTLPGGVTTLPGGVTTVPGGVTTLPGGVTTLPGATTTVAGGVATLPGTTTTNPFNGATTSTFAPVGPQPVTTLGFGQTLATPAVPIAVTLPATGSNDGMLAAISALIVGLGIVAVLTARRAKSAGA